jgi:hypothetical protein
MTGTADRQKFSQPLNNPQNNNFYLYHCMIILTIRLNAIYINDIIGYANQYTIKPDPTRDIICIDRQNAILDVNPRF